jgi:hypothetical protein
MADDDLQAALRAARAAPDDPELVQRALAAHRRAGRDAPGWLIEAQVHPARALDLGDFAGVSVLRADREEQFIRPRRPDEPARLPLHRAWWFGGTGAEAELVERATRDEALFGIDISATGGQPLGRATFEALADAPALRLLHLRHETRPAARGRPAAVEDFACLAKLRSLERLAVRSGQGAAPCLAWLERMPRLVDLALHAATSEQLARLPRTLVNLRLPGLNPLVPRPFTDAIAELPELVRFDADQSSLDDDQVAALLERWPGIEELALRGCGRLRTFAWLAGATRLRRLDLSTTRFDGAALRHLKKAPLEVLSLARCAELTDDALAHVAGMRHLRVLALDHCPGLSSKGLERLRTLKKLERLDLRGNLGTVAKQAKGRKALAKALPGCKILS